MFIKFVDEDKLYESEENQTPTSDQCILLYVNAFKSKVKNRKQTSKKLS